MTSLVLNNWAQTFRTTYEWVSFQLGKLSYHTEGFILLDLEEERLSHNHR